MATYQAVHLELKKRFGLATQHTCACGAPARDWAYQRGALDEKVDRLMGRPYSEDLGSYHPMCRSCHMRLDADLRSAPLSEQSARAHHEGVLKAGLVHAQRMQNDPDYRARTMTSSLIGRGCSLRRKCSGCGTTSNAPGIARHQRASGHQGWSPI